MRLFATPRRTTNNGDAALDGLCLDLLFPEASLAAATTAPTPVPTPAPEPAPMRLSLSSSKTQDDAAAPVSLLSLPAPALKRRPRFTLFSGLRRACAEVGGTMLGLAVAGASMVVGSRSPAATAPKAEAEAPMSAPSAAGGLESAHREEEDQQGEEEETMLAEDACVEMYDLDPPAAPLTLAGRVAKAYGRLCWGLRATRKAFLEAAAALHMAAHVVCVMCFDYGGLCMTPPDVVWERDGELYS